MAWTKVRGDEVRPRDTVIRNVEPGLEWMPGPYGAFAVRQVRREGTETVLVCQDASGWGTEIVELRYKSSEEVTVKRPQN